MAHAIGPDPLHSTLDALEEEGRPGTWEGQALECRFSKLAESQSPVHTVMASLETGNHAWLPLRSFALPCSHLAFASGDARTDVALDLQALMQHRAAAARTLALQTVALLSGVNAFLLAHRPRLWSRLAQLR